MTNKLSLHQLQPDVFSGEPMWEDFLTDFQDTIEDLIRSPIRQLETIRDVGPNSDAVVIAQTLLQLGITVPADLIVHNLNRLRHSLHFLGRLKDTLGTSEAYKVISYILGRQLEISYLHTENYRDFYNRPYASSNIDGGKWYQTTHIDLGVESVSQDMFMLLPSGVTRQKRLLDAYFEFAPVNQVIHRFYWILNLVGEALISGTVVKENTKYLTVGRGLWDITNVAVDGPLFVESGSTGIQFNVDLQFADRSGNSGTGTGTTTTLVPRLPLYGFAPIGVNSSSELAALSTEFPDTNNRQLFVSNAGSTFYGYLCYPIEMGLANFEDTATLLNGGWDGASWPDNGDIGNDFGPIVITRTIGITTSQWYLYRMDFPAVGDFTFNVSFANPGVSLFSTLESNIPSTDGSYPGHVIPALDNVWTTSNPSLVAVDSKGVISFGVVDVDTDVTVSVTTHGITDSKVIRIRGRQRIDSIYIDAPDTVSGSEQHLIKVYGVYQGVVTLLPAIVGCISPTITMHGNKMDVNGSSEDTEIELYTEYKGYHAIKRIIVKYVSTEVFIESIAIIGIGYVYEKAEVVLVCRASFSNGTQQDVYPYWETSTPLLHVGEKNTLYAGLVQSNVDTTVTASFQYRGKIVSATHAIQIRSLSITLVGLRIAGPNIISSEERVQYSVIASWSDGISSSVEGSWTINRFDIDSETGVVTTGSIEEPIALVIRVSAGGRTASLNVNAIAKPVAIQALRILGPDNVKEGILGQFSALATYSDGKETYIVPTWNLKNSVAGTTITPTGQFVFSGDVPSGIIEVEAVYSVSGQTYKQTKPIVLIPDVATILSLQVSGPIEVEENGRIQLTATVTYTDGTTEIVNPVWTAQSSDPINIPDAAADVFDRGLVQGRRVDVDTKVVIVARYFKATTSHLVKVTPLIERSPDVPETSRLIGPPILHAGNVASYAQAIVFKACSQELLVSSDWSLDVDPLIATIDSNGYLYSVNGQALPVKVTAVYNCGTYIVTNTIVVNILASNEDISSISINGPDAVIENSTTPYTVELFRVGQSPIPGQGVIVTEGVVWEILSGPSGSGVVVVDGIGSISVLTIPSDTQIILKATYTSGFSSVTVTRIIAANKSVPVFGVTNIGLRNDQGISALLDRTLPTINSNQSFTLTVGLGKYGYFAYPASLGLARFVLATSQIEGGWDGAGWPDDGSIGSSTGPLTVARSQNGVVTNWYLYRTDFTGVGTRTWTMLLG